MKSRGKHKQIDPPEAPLAKKKATLLKNVVNVINGQTQTTSKQNQNIQIPEKPVDPGDEDDASSDVVRKLTSVAVKVLEKNFRNPVERLKLNFNPPCLLPSNLKRCAEKHSKKSLAPATASYETQYITKQMIVEDRYFQFLKFVSDQCGRNEFPGSSMILTILEHILVSDIAI